MAVLYEVHIDGGEGGRGGRASKAYDEDLYIRNMDGKGHSSS